MVSIHCFLNNFVNNVDIEPCSVFRVGGIRLHPNGVFSNVLMQKKRHGSRKTYYWSNSDCSVHGRYRQRYPRVRVFNNFVINVGIEPSSRLPSLRHQMTSEWPVFECFDAKDATW